MLETHKLTQNVQIKVYETATDLPGWWESFFAGLLKALPWIGLVVGVIALGVLIYFVYRHIITTYKHTEKFWSNFTAVNSVIFLAVAGFIYVNFNIITVHFEKKNLVITVVKDQSLTASVDNPLYVRTGWANGHDLSLAVANPVERIVPSNAAYAASPDQDRAIKLALRLPDGTILEETPSEMTFVDANPSRQTTPDRYQLIAAVPATTPAGTYAVDIDWETSRRDSMISVGTAQKLIDREKDNKEVTDKMWNLEGGKKAGDDHNVVTYKNTVGGYLEPDDIPTQEMYKTNCGDDNTLIAYGLNNSNDDTKNQTRSSAKDRCEAGRYPKFHHWLNAPHPVYRENIKSITFKDSRPATSASTDDENGKYCWDISERQTKQVMACAQRRDNIHVKVGDLEGLGLGNAAADVVQWAGDAVNRVKCAADWFLSLFGVTDECDENEWNVDTLVIASFPQPLYDIVIGQDGGVNAPINSSNLFFYVGQDTDYIVDGRFMVPREKARDWYDTVDLIGSDFTQLTSEIPIIGPSIETAAIVGDFFVNLVEDPIWLTKICAQSRYYAYGPKLNDSKECTSNSDEKAQTTIDTENFIVKNVVDMSSMFEGAKFNNLSKALTPSFRNNTGKVKSMSRMFADTTDMASWTGGGSLLGLFSANTLDTSAVENFSGMFSGSRFGMCDYDSGDRCKYDKDKAYDGGECLDGGRNKCGINISKFDTSSATRMDNMFSDAREARNIVLGDIDTAKVTDMSWMFAATGKNEELDISKFDTSKVTNMAGMFSGTKLKALDITNFDTSKVTNMNRMFENLYQDKNAELDLENFDTSKVTTMEGMFSGSNVSSLNLTKFDTSKVTNMKDMFFSLGEGTTSVDLTSFNTENVTDMSWMFANITPEPTDATCDLANDIEASTAIKKTALILVPMSNARLENQTELTKLPLGDPAKSIVGKDADQEQCEMDTSDTEVQNIKISKYSKSNDAAFSRAGLDLRSFNTSKVTTMEGMFAGSKADLVNFKPSTELGADFDTSKVKNMSWMFAGIGYSAITHMPLNTDSATKMVGMFAGLFINRDNGNFDISTMEVPDGNNPDVSWMFTSSCVNGKIDGITFSESMKGYIEGLPEDDDDQNNKRKFIFEDMTDSCGSGSGRGGGTMIGDIVHYHQWDPLWANKPFSGSTFYASGCGPSSMAIILASMIDPSITPVDVGAVFGAQSGGTSSWQNAINGVHAKWGDKVRITNTSFDTAYEFVKAGKGMVWLGGGGPPPFTTGGHMVAMVGVEADGRVIIADPWGGEGQGHQDIASYPKSQIAAGLGGGIFTVEKI